MPDEITPAPSPRPLRRTLLVAGLSCLSATLIILGFTWLQRSRRTSLETNAVGSCRAYAEAQIMYRRNDWDGDGKIAYAHPYPELSKIPDPPNTICLVDSLNSFVAAQGPGGVPEHGYLFQDMQTIDGKPIDWADDFALCAMPAVYGRTGFRVFIVNTEGTVWGKDLGKSEFIADFPADPAKEGWSHAE